MQIYHRIRDPRKLLAKMLNLVYPKKHRSAQSPKRHTNASPNFLLFVKFIL
jgi:hypothetical protein